MGAEQRYVESSFREENEAFRWFQGYEDVTPVFCLRALDRMASESPEVIREKINDYPLGEQLLSRLYFSGFSDEVMSELFPGKTFEQEMIVEETEVLPVQEGELVELPASEPEVTAPAPVAVLRRALSHDNWEERALCPQTDPEAFFPEKGGSTREAKKVCNQCEVRAECLDLALKNDERFGVWGGLSERERRKLKEKLVG